MRPADPIERLRHRVDLIVVRAVWEGHHLGLELVKPWRFVRQEHMSGLDLRWLRAHAQRLVAFGLEWDSSQALGSEVLDQRGARARILDNQIAVRTDARMAAGWVLIQLKGWGNVKGARIT
jgi:hypothetical protein